jgi:hypothetical protein
LLVKRPSKPPDDHAAGAFVCGSVDALVDVEYQLRHLVVPIQIGDRLLREPAAA